MYINYKKPLGFRTGTPWKMVFAICYYIYVAYCVFNMYKTGEYGWYDGFCTLFGFLLPVEIFKSFTNRNSKTNQWLYDKGCFMRVIVNTGRIIWIMLWFCVFLVAGKTAYYKFTLDTCLPGIEYLVFEEPPLKEYYSDPAYRINSFAIGNDQGIILMDEDCLLKAEAVLIEDYGDTYYVLIDFNEKGKAIFTKAIEEDILGELNIFLDGNKMLPVADFPMVNEYAIVDDEFNKDDADLLVALINKLIFNS